jgi:hypothetical protein
MAFRFRFKKRTPQKKRIIGLILILLLLGLLIYLFQAGIIPKAEWLAKLEKSLLEEGLPVKEEPAKEEPEEGPTKEQLPAEKEEKEPPQELVEVPTIEEKENAYLLRAEKGEGITHLARRALRKYLLEEKIDFQPTPEHKIYIEDYIQNRLGERWLTLGEEMLISKDLIREAINSSQGLTEAELENLKQFSARVPALDY